MHGFSGGGGRAHAGPRLAEPEYLFQETCMNNLNSVLLEGNFVRDAMLRSTPKGAQVCVFSLACNRYYRQDAGFEHEVSYFDVECWGKLAEAVYQHGGKGRGARVVGRIKQDRWTGTDEKPHSKVVIVAEHVEFRPEHKQDGTAAHREAEESLVLEAAEEKERVAEEAVVF